MGKLDWRRYDSMDDGYYVEPLTLMRGDADSGALTHQARRQEQALVVAFLKRVAEEEHQFDHSGAMVRSLAERIEKGDHYRASQQDPENLVPSGDHTHVM